MNYLVEVKCSFHIHYWIFCFQGLNRNLRTLSRLEEMRDSYLEPSKSGGFGAGQKVDDSLLDENAIDNCKPLYLEIEGL